MYRFIQFQVVDNPTRFRRLIEPYPLKKCKDWCERFHLTCRGHTFIWEVEISFIHWLRCFSGVFPYDDTDNRSGLEVISSPPKQLENPMDIFLQRIQKYNINITEKQIAKDPDAAYRYIVAFMTSANAKIPAHESRPNITETALEIKQWVNDYRRDLKLYADYQHQLDLYNSSLDQERELEYQRNLKTMYQEWVRGRFIESIQEYLRNPCEEPSHLLRRKLYQWFKVYLSDIQHLKFRQGFDDFEMFAKRMMASDNIRPQSFWSTYFPTFRGDGDEDEYYLIYQVIYQISIFDPVPPVVVPSSPASYLTREEAIKHALDAIQSTMNIQFRVHDLTRIFRSDKVMTLEELNGLLPLANRIATIPSTDLFHDLPQAPITEDEIKQMVIIIDKELSRIHVIQPMTLTGEHAIRLKFWEMIQST
jgi:hypothetical protein